jgi:hypothetical protein
MKERPILFNAPMVRALLDGSKTQTRLAIKRQPEPPRAIYSSPGADTKITPSLVRCENGMGVAWRFEMSKITSDKGSTMKVSVMDHEPVRMVCPYGNPGDRLWVREAFAIETTQDYEGDPGIEPALGPVKWEDDDGYRLIPRYRASEPGTMLMIAPSEKDEIGMRWKPSIHMPRWASRILLEITDVRVERLQDISETDALAEGIVRQRDDGFGLTDTTHYHSADPRMSYWSLWEAINGPGSVESNPWVWAVSFKRVTPS